MENLPRDVFELVLIHASDAILLFEQDSLQIRAVNPRLEELLLYPAHQLEGRSVRELFPSEGSDTSADQVFARQGLYEEVRLVRADERPVYVSITVGYVPNGATPLAVCILRDTTAKRMLERELLTKHGALRQAHQQLHEANEELVEKNAKLEYLSNQMATLARQAAIGAFTAGISHSINNPLAALASSVRQLDKMWRSGTPDPDRADACLKRNKIAIERIQSVVTNMRRVHRTGDTTPTSPEWVSLADELRTAADLVRHRVKPPGSVEIRCEVEREVRVHRESLQSLLGDLLDNAVNATDEQGQIVVGTGNHDGQTIVFVEDNGPGVPDDVRETLFEPFITTRPDGTGLGLANAMRVAHLHRGSLTVERTQENKTRFVFQMPSLGLEETQASHQGDRP